MDADLDLVTGPADPAGVGRIKRRDGFAIDGLRQHGRHEPFADALVAVKQQGMRQAIALHGGLQESFGLIVADNGVKRHAIRPW